MRAYASLTMSDTCTERIVDKAYANLDILWADSTDLPDLPLDQRLFIIVTTPDSTPSEIKTELTGDGSVARVQKLHAYLSTVIADIVTKYPEYLLDSDALVERCLSDGIVKAGGTDAFGGLEVRWYPEAWSKMDMDTARQHAVELRAAGWVAKSTYDGSRSESRMPFFSAARTFLQRTILCGWTVDRA